MTQCSVDERRVYPAQFHFRIIVETASKASPAIQNALRDHQVIAPLSPGRSSGAGRYHSLTVTVHLEDRAQHERLDKTIRSINGVRLLL